MTQYRHLFQPITINGVQVRNRVALCPMCLGYAEEDGSVNDRVVGYFAARARGGAGLIFTGYTFIDDVVSRSSPNQMGIYSDRLIPGLSRLAGAAGAEADKTDRTNRTNRTSGGDRRFKCRSSKMGVTGDPGERFSSPL